MDLEETNKPMSSAHRVSVNSRGPRTKTCEYWWQKARGEVLVLLTQKRGFFIVLCFSNMGVVRMMKEMKLSCCKCHFEFFFLPQWQMMKKDTHPSLLISFFTPTMTAKPHKRDETLILHLHISHNTPCLPPKHFVYALSSISLEVTGISRRN